MHAMVRFAHRHHELPKMNAHVSGLLCRWTVRAHVTANPSLQHLSNSCGERQVVMSVELVDESVSQLPTSLPPHKYCYPCPPSFLG